MTNPKLRLYERDPDTGARVPWIYELEEDRKTITAKYVDHKLWERMRADAARAAGGSLEDGIVVPPTPGDKKGYIQKKTPKGVVLIELTDFDRQFAVWMTSMQKNPFPGTDNLRDAFLEKLEALGCSNCDASKLISEYKERVARFVESQEKD